MYTTFTGIDIGKFEFVVGFAHTKTTHTYANTPTGIAEFLEAHHSLLRESFIVLETTGGYEKALLQKLTQKEYAVHRANTRRVKSFIRSFGGKAKTDRLDAQALAKYGKERHAELALYAIPEKAQEELKALVERRLDLSKLLAAEKNRIQSPGQSEAIQRSCQKAITFLQEEVALISKTIQEFIRQQDHWAAKQEVLESIHGIGPVISASLLALVPELGTLNRGQVASLLGLAPYAYESGTYKGYRKTRGGRTNVRNLLFMAAMTARNDGGPFQEFYEGLIRRGKKKMVALVALMRKLVITANAILKKFNQLVEGEARSPIAP